MTKREALVKFLEEHGPSRLLGPGLVSLNDGKSFRVSRAWVTRYMIDKVIAVQTVYTIKRQILIICFSAKEDS